MAITIPKAVIDKNRKLTKMMLQGRANRQPLSPQELAEQEEGIRQFYQTLEAQGVEIDHDARERWIARTSFSLQIQQALTRTN